MEDIGLYQPAALLCLGNPAKSKVIAAAGRKAVPWEQAEMPQSIALAIMGEKQLSQPKEMGNSKFTLFSTVRPLVSP